MLSKDNFYFCYSNKLSHHLQSKGFRYLFMARELNKGNPFSLYELSPELRKELELYKLNK